MLKQSSLEALAGVLAALIRMKHQTCMPASYFYRHPERFGDQVGVIDQRKCPPNDSSGEQVDDHGQVVPTFPDHQTGNVAAPDLIDGCWLKITFKQILGHKCLNPSGAIRVATALPAGQVCLCHEFSSQIPSNPELLGLQTLRNHSRPRTFSAFSMQLHDLCPEHVTLGIRR
jgi:hypothetical protein